MGKKEKIPLVSVIIPTYNRGWIIQEAIDSVLAQDFSDFELIVVDDGSTDNTLDIIRSYSEDIIFLRQPNKGVSAARNQGITSSAGHLIAFLDSDDLWFPEKLTIQVDFLHSHPDAFICQSEEIWIRNGVRVNPKKRHKKPSGMIFEPSLPACEDYDLWLRVSSRYPIALIDTPLVIKRGGHQDQLSRAPGLDKFRIQAIKKLLDSNLLSMEQQGHAVKALKEKCAIYASGCLKRSRLDEAEYYTNLLK
ncbi:MAG: glycosyltransferase family 2 protein [Deltaproteobacteria bacterium]|nr:glycosyltransferase family 2 protein [Deltaproteobacteria bacterium]